MKQQFLADCVGVIALVRQHRLDLIGHQPEEWQEAAVVVDFSAGQPKAYRSAFAVTTGVDFGRETASGPAKGRLTLIPPFTPAAH